MSRKTVYELLSECAGEYLSGEALSERLGVSRAAVWKTISALRREGYEIEAVRGRGYRLLRAPDRLTQETIRARLGEVSRVGRELRCFESIDSTNSYLKRVASELAPDGTVAVADEQTGGRGRRGRSFLSPSGRGIYLSALLRPELPPDRLMTLTGFAAVAVCNAVERTARVRPQIKWTNDLVLGGRKLCGILTELGIEGETGTLDYVVLGIGVNVLHESGDFPEELSSIATSLWMETGQRVERAALTAAMIEELDRLYSSILAGDTRAYLDAYRRDCLTIGKEVQLLWRDVSERVEALGVDDELGLIVRRADGTEEVIRTGEVSVRGLYGYVE